MLKTKITIVEKIIASESTIQSAYIYIYINKAEINKISEDYVFNFFAETRI